MTIITQISISGNPRKPLANAQKTAPERPPVLSAEYRKRGESRSIRHLGNQQLPAFEQFDRLTDPDSADVFSGIATGHVVKKTIQPGRRDLMPPCNLLDRKSRIGEFLKNIPVDLLEKLLNKTS